MVHNYHDKIQETLLYLTSTCIKNPLPEAKTVFFSKQHFGVLFIGGY